MLWGRCVNFGAASSPYLPLVSALDEEAAGQLLDCCLDDMGVEATLRDVVTMSSGIRYVERGLPWSDDALTYYGTDLCELALTRTRMDDEPGEIWRYNNYHPLLLGLVLGVILAFVREYMARVRHDPDNEPFRAALDGFRSDMGGLVGRRVDD